MRASAPKSLTRDRPSRASARAKLSGGKEVRDLDRRVQRLPPEQREVLLLVSVEELSYQEVAAVTGVPVGTVMSRLSRARARLRDEMASPGQVRDPVSRAAGKIQRVK